ncbi:chitinase [Anaerotaenia torta]|uniref:glycoside hydrolase family 18 protein n=1 Tax=Anaerotaenia torta TaxID=433293 RepID=UPI003D2042B9
MKIKKGFQARLLIAALALGMLGCSGVKKETEIDKKNKAPDSNTEKALEITPLTDPLISEIVKKPKRIEEGPRSIAYFTSWSAYDRAITVKDIDPELLTHINFAFANLSQDGEVMVGDEYTDLTMDFGTELGGSAEDACGHFGQLRQLKAKYPKLKVLISIGGWGWSANFSDVAADPVKRDRFAVSAADFVARYGLDGVDIDWEYPVEGGDNIPHRAGDDVNYTMLIKATRKALNERKKPDGDTYLLTIAARAAERFIADSNLLETMQYVDFINLMTYDFHGAWENVTGFNSPLYDASGQACIDTAVTAFLGAGIPGRDINLGLAFYGRGWTNVASTENQGLNQRAQVPVGIGYGLGTWEAGAFDAWDLMENYADKNGFVRYYDETAQCPYVFDGTTWIGYDDVQSIQAKTEYAVEKGLGGVMFWEFSGDRKLVLQKTITKVLEIGKEK